MLMYFSFIFFFNDTATTEIYTLSLHDALPIFAGARLGVALEVLGHVGRRIAARVECDAAVPAREVTDLRLRSEEHTSELQSRQYLVCRLLLEKKKRKQSTIRK